MPDFTEEQKAQLEQEKREHEERQQKLKEASALFKKHRGYAAARVRVADQVGVLRKNKPIDGLERFSEPILEHAFEYSEIHAREYLILVDDQEHLEAYAAILDDLARRSWFQLSGLPMGIVQPYTPFAKPLPEQLKLRKIHEQTARWITEAYRRIAQRQSSIEEAPARRGYRDEVRSWMKENGFTSTKLAAKRLGVSDSILKSIMTTKGRARYGPETLDDILGKIGLKTSGRKGD